MAVMAEGDTTGERVETIDSCLIWSIWVVINSDWEQVFLEWGNESLPHQKGVMKQICRKSLMKTLNQYSFFQVSIDEFQEKLEDNFVAILETTPDISLSCECGGSKCKLPHSNWCPLG